MTYSFSFLPVIRHSSELIAIRSALRANLFAYKALLTVLIKRTIFTYIDNVAQMVNFVNPQGFAAFCAKFQQCLLSFTFFFQPTNNVSWLKKKDREYTSLLVPPFVIKLSLNNKSTDAYFPNFRSIWGLLVDQTFYSTIYLFNNLLNLAPHSYRVATTCPQRDNTFATLHEERSARKSLCAQGAPHSFNKKNYFYLHWQRSTSAKSCQPSH